MIDLEPLAILKSRPGVLFERLRNSAVVWSWIFNGFRLAAGFILLPLVLNKLPTAELGMYYVLLSLAALVPLVDFGFSPTIGRFVSYAMGGAESLQAQGVARPGGSGAPNYGLLWNLLLTTRTLYRSLTLILFVVLGAWGTYVVHLRANETTSPSITWLAWAVTLVSALFDIYSNWWVIYLRSLNEVLPATRISVLAAVLRLLLAAVLLLCGAGLLSLPIASFLGSWIQRHLARRRCRQMLEGHAPPQPVDVKATLRILWPNTWRLGLQFIGAYLTVNANIAICLSVLGLAASAQYGLSVQLLTFISGMVGVWTSVKWPIIGQYRARHDLLGMQRVLRPRVWLQTFTYLAACAGLLLCGPYLMVSFGGGKQMLPLGWFALMMFNGFFEMQFIIWGTLLSTENRLPYLWPALATNVLSFGLSLALVRFTSLGVGALVLGPFLAGILFNHWYWPPYAARALGTNLTHLMFVGSGIIRQENERAAKNGERG
jgi:hypothetical protein